MYNMLIIKQYGVISKKFRNPSTHQKYAFAPAACLPALTCKRKRVANILNTCDIYFFFTSAIFRKKILERPRHAKSERLYACQGSSKMAPARFFYAFYYKLIRVTPILRTLASLQQKTCNPSGRSFCFFPICTSSRTRMFLLHFSITLTRYVYQ
jgi:hypothetical protein